MTATLGFFAISFIAGFLVCLILLGRRWRVSDYTVDELKDKIRAAAAQLEHIKKWHDGSQSLEELRHAIDHALSDLDLDEGSDL